MLSQNLLLTAVLVLSGASVAQTSDDFNPDPFNEPEAKKLFNPDPFPQHQPNGGPSQEWSISATPSRVQEPNQAILPLTSRQQQLIFNQEITNYLNSPDANFEEKASEFLGQKKRISSPNLYRIAQEALNRDSPRVLKAAIETAGFPDNKLKLLQESAIILQKMEAVSIILAETKSFAEKRIATSGPFAELDAQNRFNSEIMQYMSSSRSEDFVEKTKSFLKNKDKISSKNLYRIAREATRHDLPEFVRAVIDLPSFPQKRLQGIQSWALESGKVKVSYLFVDRNRLMAAARIAKAPTSPEMIAGRVAAVLGRV